MRHTRGGIHRQPIDPKNFSQPQGESSLLFHEFMRDKFLRRISVEGRFVEFGVGVEQRDTILAFNGGEG